MTTPFPFQSGAVLQASQLNAITTLPINDQTDDYTLVVGDVGKRVIMNKATANTVTVDDSIFAEGDTIFIANKGAGVSTITAGAGVTINSASGLALVTSQSGQLVALSASSFIFFASDVTATPGGLVQVTSVSFSASSAVAFAAGVFDATYDNYRVLLEFVPSANCNLSCQVNVSGSAQTSNQYFGNRYNLRAENVTNQNPGTSHTIMGANGSTPAHNTLSIDVFVPAVAAVRTSWHGTWYGANAATQFDGGVTSALYNVAEADDGLTFTPSTGTITGKYTVYGYN